MKLETFFEKFDQFADAPNAVAKMRELVLNMAFQGKLVPQDPSDEPAAELVKRIQAEKVRLLARGASRREKAIPNTDNPRVPFVLPNGWCWSQLGDLSLAVTSGSRDWAAYYANEGAIFVRMGNLSRNSYRLRLDKIQRVAPPSKAEGERTRLKAGDILISITGEVGLLGLIPDGFGEAYINQHTCLVRLPGELQNRFIPEFLRSSFAQTHFNAPQRGLKNSFRLTDVTTLPTPLPPLPEQRRIVAKVDELMALCDRLEAQQKEGETRHAVLVRASLGRFADAPTPANLQFLFHKSYAIAPSDLRKSILTLAVQGKLVPQNPEDEAAENGLARLCLKRAASPLNGDMADGTLPVSWTRVRFEDIALVAGGVTLGRKLGEQKTVTLPYLRVANVKRGEVDLRVVKEVSIPEDEIARYALHDNDLLMTEGGDWDKVGRAAVWRGQIPICLHQNHVFRARMRSTEILPFWFERYFNSPDGRSYFELASKQTTNLASINMRQVRGCPVPFPPLAEQDRIVAKIDQLMALVDQLEVQLAASRGTAAKLMEAIVTELTAQAPIEVRGPDLASDPRSPCLTAIPQ